MQRKREAALFFVLCIILSLLPSCGRQEEKRELTVFAAASLTETLTEIGELFVEQNPEVEIVFNFDSSGTLRTQILEGAECDVFISAGQSQMDDLEGRTEGRFDLLENKVALAVPEGNPAGIRSCEELAERLAAGEVFLAIGNADVPVGQYTQKILACYELNEEELAATGSVTYGSNVKEIVTQISEAAVDCGIIYQTDAFSAGLTVVDTATPDMCGQVIYPAAVLRGTEKEELAKAFLDFCTGNEADAIFEAVGFSPMA